MYDVKQIVEGQKVALGHNLASLHLSGEFSRGGRDEFLAQIIVADDDACRNIDHLRRQGGHFHTGRRSFHFDVHGWDNSGWFLFVSIDIALNRSLTNIGPRRTMHGTLLLDVPTMKREPHDGVEIVG